MGHRIYAQNSMPDHRSTNLPAQHDPKGPWVAGPIERITHQISQGFGESVALSNEHAETIKTDKKASFLGMVGVATAIGLAATPFGIGAAGCVMIGVGAHFITGGSSSALMSSITLRAISFVSSTMQSIFQRASTVARYAAGGGDISTDATVAKPATPSFSAISTGSPKDSTPAAPVASPPHASDGGLPDRVAAAWLNGEPAAKKAKKDDSGHADLSIDISFGKPHSSDAPLLPSLLSVLSTTVPQPESAMLPPLSLSQILAEQNKTLSVSPAPPPPGLLPDLDSTHTTSHSAPPGLQMAPLDTLQTSLTRSPATLPPLNDDLKWRLQAKTRIAEREARIHQIQSTAPQVKTQVRGMDI